MIHIRTLIKKESSGMMVEDIEVKIRKLKEQFAFAKLEKTQVVEGERSASVHCLLPRYQSSSWCDIDLAASVMTRGSPVDR